MPKAEPVQAARTQSALVIYVRDYRRVDPMERLSSFKYLGVYISEDLTWTAHIQTQVKKARQRLYHLRQLRKFRASPAILKTFY